VPLAGGSYHRVITDYDLVIVGAWSGNMQPGPDRGPGGVSLGLTRIARPHRVGLCHW